MTNPETRDWTTWWEQYGVPFRAKGDYSSTTQEMTGLARDPRFVVQYITRVNDSLTIGEGSGAPPGRDFYLVTGRSTGGSGNANAVVQSTYARR
jgi:hypothetical protein